MGKLNLYKRGAQVFTSALVGAILFFTQQGKAWMPPTLFKDTAQQKVEIKKDQVLLYFWATWCPDCKKSLQTKLPKVDTSHLQILGVNTDAEASDVEEYRSQNKVVIQSVVDADKSLRKEFKVFSVPTAVLIKKQGDQWITAKTYVGEELALLSQDLQGQKP